MTPDLVMPQKSYKDLHENFKYLLMHNKVTGKKLGPSFR